MAVTLQAGNALEYSFSNQANGHINELYRMNLGQSANTILLEVKSNKWPALHQQVAGNANKDNFTLALVFHGHLLDNGLLGQITIGGQQAAQWKLGAIYDPDKKETTIYLLYTESPALKNYQLILQNLAVNTNFSEAASMELRYRLKDGDVVNCQQAAITVLSHQGSPQSPFKLWLDTPKLSTELEKTNHVLSFRLLNSSGRDLDIHHMRLQMFFDIYEKEYHSPEALVTKQVFEARFKQGETVRIEGLSKDLIESRIAGYQGVIDINPAGNSLPKKTLQKGKFLNIDFINFSAFHFPGHSTIHLRYFNVKGYWDGALEATVERTAYMESFKKRPELGEKQTDVTIALSKGQSVITNKLALGEHLWVRDAGSDPQTSVLLSSNGSIKATANIQGEVLKGQKLQSKLTNNQFADLVPPGTIVMWSGSTPPKGWVLCDGKAKIAGKNVPNLSGRFVIGSGYKSILDENGNLYEHNYEIGKEKGSERVKLGVDHLPSHTHKVSGNTKKDGAHQHKGFEKINVNGAIAGTTVWKFSQNAGGTSPGWMTRQGQGETHKHQIDFDSKDTGKDKWHDNMPPYYALAYIIKL